MDIFKGGTKKVSICDTTDERGAAQALGGKFLREDCGFFEQCAHRVEDYDFTQSANGNAVEIWYCQIDWTKAGPVLLVVLAVLFYAYKKINELRFGGSGGGYTSSWARKRPSFSHGSRFRR